MKNLSILNFKEDFVDIIDIYVAKDWIRFIDNSKLTEEGQNLKLSIDSNLVGWGTSNNSELMWDIPLGSTYTTYIDEIPNITQPTLMGRNIASMDACYNSPHNVAFLIDTNNKLWGMTSAQFNYILGDLQHPEATTYATPVPLNLEYSWTSVKTDASYHTLGLQTDGTLWAWGWDGQGEIGQNLPADTYRRPVQIGTDSNWVEISCMEQASFARKSDGTLWSWGSNLSGNLGHNDTVVRSSPTQIGTDTDWAAIVVSTYGTAYALKTNGTLWSWGKNAHGQLGLNDAVNRSSPTQIGTDTDWAILPNKINSAGMAAIKTSGTLWTWGSNTEGELGHNDTINKSTPTQVGTDTDWASISLNYIFLGIKTNGTMWGCGDNREYLIDHTTYDLKSTPVQIGSDSDWKQALSTYANFAYAIKTDNTIWSWGETWSYITGFTTGETQYIYPALTTPTPLSNESNWESVVVNTTAYLATKTDKSVWGWGYNTYGGLGLNNNINEVSKPTLITSITDWTKISVANRNVFFLKQDGTIWGAGYNTRGQLGQNDIIHRSTPTQIGVDTDWVDIAAGSYVVLALKSDQSLWAWGDNREGALGTNDFTYRSTPTLISSDAWSYIHTYSDSSYGIKADGSLWAWGENNNGQLGTNNNITQLLPTQVGIDTNWKSITGGYSHTIAVKTDGTLWSWGWNEFGELGLGTTIIFRSTPTQIGTDVDWIEVFAGPEHSGALKTDNTLWVWGRNDDAQLGNGKIDPAYKGKYNSHTPIQVGTITNWKSISFARYAVFAVVEPLAENLNQDPFIDNLYWSTGSTVEVGVPVQLFWETTNASTVDYYISGLGGSNGLSPDGNSSTIVFEITDVGKKYLGTVTAYNSIGASVSASVSLTVV